MDMATNTPVREEERPFWLRTKFYYVIIAAVVFLALALTGTVSFSSDQVMIFVLGLAGLGIAGHTVTDVAYQMTHREPPNPEPEA